MSIAPEQTHHHSHDHLIKVLVNKQAVHVEGPETTGLKIKEAAIAAGVRIELSFLLSEKIGEHRTRVIGDNEQIRVHHDSVFVAVADDDNS